MKTYVIACYNRLEDINELHVIDAVDPDDCAVKLAVLKEFDISILTEENDFSFDNIANMLSNGEYTISIPIEIKRV